MANNNINSLLSMEYQAPNPVNTALAMDYEEPQKPKETVPNPAAAPSKGAKVAHGLADTEYGVGQLVEHVPVLNTIVSGWRQLIQQSLKTAGFGHASEIFNQSESGGLTDQKAADEFDGIVRKREQDYQAARQAAGQTGIDWWRLGGQAANPMNYLGGGAATSVMGRIAQGAGQGAMIAAEQPTEVNDNNLSNLITGQTPGSYWWDKTKNMIGGAFTGGAASGLIELVSPVLRAGIGFARNYLGNKAADTAASEAVINDALRAKGVDPASVDLNVLSGMRQEVKDALASGAEDISPEAILNRAKAETLPVPVKLMRGQATGDPMLYSTEQNLRGIGGVGEPLTQRLQEQNQAFIQNLDALGAKDAPDTVSAGNMLASKVQKFWDGLQQQKTQLYDAVKNSQGLSAKVDGQGAGQEIRETLGSPQAFHAWMTLPDHIKQTVADLEDGKLDLTVSNLQALDKSWGADAAAADGSTAHAINQARAILGKADIQDDVGKESMQAYGAAKQAHAAQMGLLESKLLNGMPNPHFQPLVKAVIQDGKLDDVFIKGFMGASPSEAAKNLSFLKQIDPDSEKLIGQTMMWEIKRLALSNVSDERGAVSQSVLTQWARDPVKSARMDAVLPKPLVGTFRNLADTVEVAKHFPVASTVNTSNTGSAMINAATSALKSGATAGLLKKFPLIGDVMPVAAAVKNERLIQSALNPGVTLKSLIQGTPKQGATNRLLSRLVVPAAIAATKSDKKSSKQPED